MSRRIVMITPNEEERRSKPAAPLIAKLEYLPLAATVVVNLLAAAPLLLGGAWLLFLGGSWFYIAAGAAFLAVGVTLHRRRSVSLALYAALLVVTAGWSLFETGLDLWPLVSRLDFFLLLGIWMLMPWIRRPLQPKLGSPTVALASACALVAARVDYTRERGQTRGCLDFRDRRFARALGPDGDDVRSHAHKSEGHRLSLLSTSATICAGCGHWEAQMVVRSPRCGQPDVPAFDVSRRGVLRR